MDRPRKVEVRTLRASVRVRRAGVPMQEIVS